MNKVYFSGSHRARHPEATLALVTPFLKEIGVTRVANITGLDVIGIPVVVVCRPNAKTLSTATGKGINLLNAKVSGIMEALELYHAENIDQSLKLSTYSDLHQNHPVIEIDGLPRLNISDFHPDKSILWIEGQSITPSDTASVWLPHETVHTNYTLPLPTGSGSFIMSTNGLASGNSVLEATNHAIGELIERDAMTLFEISNDEYKQSRLLKLDTINSPEATHLLDLYHQANVPVNVWDITSDIDIPAFKCEILYTNPLDPGILLPVHGYGCHPSREIALLRALTEAAQSRLNLIAGSRDDIAQAMYQKSYTRIDTKDGKRNFRDVVNYQHQDLASDLSLLLDRLALVGIHQVVRVNLTKSKFNIPVVKVVIPGLEGMIDIPEYKLGQRAKNRLEKINIGV